jgi:hypothetical protein
MFSVNTLEPWRVKFNKDYKNDFYNLDIKVYLLYKVREVTQMIILKLINKLLDKLTDDIIYLIDNECLRELVVWLGLFTFSIVSTALIVQQIFQ